MLNSKALTKIQSVVLVAIIVVAVVGGVAAYVFLNDQEQSSGTIKIGVLGDLDMLIGKSAWEGVVLAAEQINAAGGVLGRTIEVIAEDSDSESGTQDIVVASAALNRLLGVHKVDYILTPDGTPFMLSYQETISEHKTILFGVLSSNDEFTQRVLDDYQKYKYYFRTFPNATHALFGFTDSLVSLREYSGFNKIAFLAHGGFREFVPIFSNFVSEGYDFEVVYSEFFITDTLDFSSYLAGVEDSGAEILYVWVGTEDGIRLVKEWYDRQSPCVIWGYNAYVGDANGWELTDGKCEHTTNGGFPVTAGYPLTSQTLPMREAYFERWGKYPLHVAAAAYDTLRFILYDALERAQTTETETVITSLEETSIETSLARDFVFTHSHDVMGSTDINNPEEDYMVGMLFQWQDAKLVPMTPQKIKEEAGSIYTYPPWPGPWDDQ
ncbi:ABC transporter substrate-binding protein [Candidatus Bathyarchaeota archaeon]|nr:ABC transporter substrate-binding protein [Candidatus Bathyarchaeota archaeon]